MEYHSGGSLPLLGRPRYCPGANANGGYLCETGHCCGETGCCTYYYELWWFWLLWTVLILFSCCCCAYRHRRAKLRVQQQQRQREISLLAYHGANSYPSSMLDLSFLASLKLPSYEEVAAQPSTPPPPYSSVFTTPRYPQPPRTVDPHLLTQHGPLLHRPLSDGPSSLSSDNSSSCSCDSCCPSSPCSSSLSAPVTYETDTSHASTPSEAAPLTLDVTMETITAAANCLEVNETQIASERMVATVAIDISNANAAGAQEPVATDPSVPNQTVTVAVVTRAASPQPLPSPGSEVALPIGITSPIKQQLDLTLCTPIVRTCSSSTVPSPSIVDTTLPSIQILSTGGPAEGLGTTPTLKITSGSGPSTPTDSTSDRPTTNLTLETLQPTRTFDTADVPSSPTSVPSPDIGRTLALITGSAGLPTVDPNSSLVPIPAPSILTQALDAVPSNLIQASIPVPSNLTLAPDPVPANLNQSPEAVPTNLTSSPDPVLPNLTQAPEPVPSKLTPFTDPVFPNLTQAPEPNLTPVSDPQTKTNLTSESKHNSVQTPAHSNLTLATDAAPTSPTLAPCQNPELSPGSGLSLVRPSPEVPTDSGPHLVLSQLSESDIISPLPPNIQAGFSSGYGSRSGVGSRSAITIEPESSFDPSQSPLPHILPHPPLIYPLLQLCLPPPSQPQLYSWTPSLLCTSPTKVDLPLAMHPHSPRHLVSLSPSGSLPVDVFEPGPPNWEDGEEEQEEEDNDDDEDEDMGADESQYRHRRLTGDSGIEVCRCRVEEEDDEEEEEEEEGERKEDGRRGGGGERDKKGGGNSLISMIVWTALPEVR
ncbi:mucin-2-like protein [Lates japonicus]|uniref:Mucin-2-like protein n=1 Tax=Lates japonicus TaxID=270547 RepID=A0AAD3RI05_LATJO|nr:mucin-2-like protein [Lates japonicus]